MAVIALYSQKFKKEQGYSANVCFEVKIGDNTQKFIFNRLTEGEYSPGLCQIVSAKKNGFF